MKSEFVPTNNTSILGIKEYKNTYVIKSNNALKIQLKPWISGRNLQYLAYKCSMEFLVAYYITSRKFKENTIKDIVELVPLSGSLFYDMPRAFAKIFNNSLSSCYVGASRFLDDNSDWQVKLNYFNLEAMSESTKIIIIGDTIATGSTISGLLDTFIKKYPQLEEIAIFSIAGAIPGLERIENLENRNKIPIYCYFSNAIFGLAENGTDMFWKHQETIAPEDMLAKAIKSYEDLTDKWCTVWDWGKRCKDPLSHLLELEERCQSEIVNYNKDNITYKKIQEIQESINLEKKLLSEQINFPVVPRDLFY